MNGVIEWFLLHSHLIAPAMLLCVTAVVYGACTVCDVRRTR